MCLCTVRFRALKSSQHSLCSLLVVDTPGFQNPRLAKRECSATFEDLCHNYTQERLHGLFYQRTFVQELERYKEVRSREALCTVQSWGLVVSLSSPFSLWPPLPLWCISSNRVCAVLTHQMHYPFHLSQAVTSQAHVLDLLISDACLRLFCRDQSEVTHNMPLGDTPSCAAAALLPDEGTIFLLPSFDFCLTELDHNQAQSSRRI